MIFYCKNDRLLRSAVPESTIYWFIQYCWVWTGKSVISATVVAAWFYFFVRVCQMRTSIGGFLILTINFAKKNKTKQLLRRVSKELRDNLKRHFPRYIFRISQRNGYFYVLVTIPGGDISNNEKDFLIKNILLISRDIYRKHSANLYFKYNYFPYFQLLSSGSYHKHYNFLVIRKH